MKQIDNFLCECSEKLNIVKVNTKRKSKFSIINSYFKLQKHKHVMLSLLT